MSYELKLWACYCGHTIVPIVNHNHAEDCAVARYWGYGIIEV